jgi:hypothetical protein
MAKQSPDDKDNDDDELIWEMLRDWIAQEQRMMVADQPPSERPRQRGQQEDGPSAEEAESFESSGDDKETVAAIVATKKTGGKIVTVELLGETKAANPARVEERFVDDLVPAEEMAVAESLILLPSTSPAKPQIHPAQQQQPKDSPARSDAASFNSSQTSAGQHLLLLTGEEEEDEEDGDGEGRASTEFAYDDHVVEIVQLDPLPAVIPVVAGSQLRRREEPAEEPLMNKTTSNSAVDVIADSSSHPSSGGGDDEEDDFKLLSQPPPPSPPAAVGTIGPSQNDDVPRLSSSSSAQEEEAAAAGSTLPILDANVSSQPLNGTNDTLPPDGDEIEPDPAVNGTWPPVIVPPARPWLAAADGDANGVVRDSSSQSLLSVSSLAGNISEELLSPWLPPDVISYRGPVVQSDFLIPTESTTTVAVTAASPADYAGCDCQCPFADALATPSTDSDAAAVDSIPTSVLTTPQSIPDPVPLSCPTPPPPPPACVMTEALTTTTTAMPATTTEATTTPTPTTTTATTTTTTKMIPPILILEGEGRRGFQWH